MPDNPTPRRNRPTINGNFNFDSNQWNTFVNSSIPTPRDIDEEEIELNQAQQDTITRIRNRRPRNTVGQVLDTVGIELESIGLYKDTVANILARLPDGLGNNFRVHRDGSSEINAYFVPINGGRSQIIINSHTKEAEELFEGKYSKKTLGYELISVPMDIDTAEMSLWVLLPSLESNGDFISERCATHIHVGGMKNLQFLKNSLKLGLWFDEVFYSLAHMDGEKFRGCSNNAIYARPLINGPYFKYDRGYFQILNWEAALEADDIYEFFNYYGANVNSEMPKYHPGRYFSINLYSIPRIGTLEFRHFNQSFNPEITSSVTKLCQLFVEIAMKAKDRQLKKLDPCDVFTLNSTDYYLDKLYRFLDLGQSLDCEYSLGKEDVYTLEKVIYNYKGIGIENKEVLTHCRDFEVPSDIIESGMLNKAKNKPIPDGHTDIHNIKYSSILKG